MKISYNWLKEFIDFDCSPEELAGVMTVTGSEVEAMEEVGASPEGIVTGKVLKVEKHPDADRLTVCTVDVGSETLTAVCGAPNVAENQNIIFAKVGAVLADGTKLKRAKIRGVESFGMIVAEDEIGISDDHGGIIVLDKGVKPGIAISEIVNLKDYIYELEITPNRPDCLSHLGMAREIKAKLGGRIKYPSFEVEESAPATGNDLKIEIDDPDGCPRYTGRLISGVKIAPSPLWLKARLHSLGVRPISNVVDITNYVLMETGQPLHAFDNSFIGTGKIVVKRAMAGEKFITLDDQERTLNAEHLLITNGEKAVALAGIMGGQNSEVNDNTTDILLESAYFDAVVTRRGAKALKMSTEASQRFERGADIEMAPRANNRACSLIAELAGGKVHEGLVDTYVKKFVPVEIAFRPERANSVLGFDIKADNMLSIFDGLDITYEKSEPLKVIQPSFRPDLVREIDLVEEIARIYGLDNIENSYRPGGTLETEIDPKLRFRNNLRDYLVSRGFFEAFSITLIDSKQLQKINNDAKTVSLMNPLSEEMSDLRPDLIISMLKILKHNINFGNKDAKLYEIGSAYLPNGTERPDEPAYICIGTTGNERPTSWHHTETPGDFYSIKAELEAIAEYFKLGKLQLAPQGNPYYNDEQSFKIYIDNDKKILGVVGKVSKTTAKTIGLKQDSYIAQLDIDLIAELALKPMKFSELPKFPSTDRDIALVVDNNIPALDIINSIYKAGGKIVVDVFPFDLYKGENIAEGRKSIAFRIIYRSDDKTLTDAETDKVHDRVVKEVTKSFGAELRA